MILTLKRLEITVLLLHMSIMRNSVKKWFKKAYGSKEGKELTKRFDEVKKQFESQIEQEESNFNFNINEFDMIYTFVMWYKPKLEEMLKAAGKVKEEDQGQLNCLQDIISHMEEVKKLYA
ncbi:hypothetical protein LCY76_22795 [Fictibacillus sp. KIGAM418]|uniref:Uncharacterized protein n=1 Tax=Fictibacillus marinisediminis TaxID=2878389 RepID=A0A9X2BEX5_9BACL|nr:hypothetical protein [Fictibacillus marinisediminis]MCK6259404.1 hypothetical protein [Fictibacillus marinisediminis]